jgi:hypothetical protein
MQGNLYFAIFAELRRLARLLSLALLTASLLDFSLLTAFSNQVPKAYRWTLRPVDIVPSLGLSVVTFSFYLFICLHLLCKCKQDDGYKGPVPPQNCLRCPIFFGLDGHLL